MNEIEERASRLAQAWSVPPGFLTADLSESDVRAKLIDPLFTIGLGWPESLIRREEHTDANGFIDYAIGWPKRSMLVEAKRDSSEFVFPSVDGTLHRRFKIKRLIATNKALAEAFEQAARYAFDQAIPYAVLANGRQIVVFRPHRLDRPWREGSCEIFRDPADILTRFGEVYDLLGYPNVITGSLDRHFMFPDEVPRSFQSPIAGIGGADDKLIRNRLANTLSPIMRQVFDDVTDESTINVLRNCYVFSEELRATADDFILAVRDLPPRYLAAGISNIKTTPQSGGLFQEAVQTIAAGNRRGAVLLLLGGVGAGKTTFLRQVRTLYCRDTIDNTGSYFYLDFRNAPEASSLERFVYDSLYEQATSDPLVRATVGAGETAEDVLQSPEALSSLFTPELGRVEALARTAGFTDGAAIAQRRLDELLRLSADTRAIVRRVMERLSSAGRFILLAFDNADQLDLEYQLKIFLFAQSVASETGANVVVALREEKYYVASQHGAFNAFHTQQYHIPSPRLTTLLRQRLRYAIANADALTPHATPEERADAVDFMNAILTGGVGLGSPRQEGSSNVVRLLERICLGNMRLALTMFRNFMQSGNTNIAKILSIYRENRDRQRVPYHVPFHEFTKSVMLGDYKHYRERHNDTGVLNLFAGSGFGLNSHFTALRLLVFLMERSERPSPKHGPGFAEKAEIYGSFDLVFGDHGDAEAQLQRLLRGQLVEANTTSLDLSHAAAVKATPAGEYYLTYLVKAFAYIDLVWMDTAISDAAVVQRLRELVEARDLNGRMERVDSFIHHLTLEEEREFRDFPLLRGRVGWGEPRMPFIVDQLQREKRVIANRFARYWRDGSDA